VTRDRGVIDEGALLCALDSDIIALKSWNLSSMHQSLIKSRASTLHRGGTKKTTWLTVRVWVLIMQIVKGSN
jgi:hypothetical protein